MYEAKCMTPEISAILTEHSITLTVQKYMLYATSNKFFK